MFLAKIPTYSKAPLRYLYVFESTTAYMNNVAFCGSRGS